MAKTNSGLFAFSSIVCRNAYGQLNVYISVHMYSRPAMKLCATKHFSTNLSGELIRDWLSQAKDYLCQTHQRQSTQGSIFRFSSIVWCGVKIGSCQLGSHDTQLVRYCEARLVCLLQTNVSWIIMCVWLPRSFKLPWRDTHSCMWNVRNSTFGRNLDPRTLWLINFPKQTKPWLLQNPEVFTPAL